MSTVNASVAGKDLYLRIHRKDGTSYLTEHRVWGDGSRFVQSQIEQHTKEGRIVEIASKADYVAYRNSVRSK